jgi:hydroxymethylpyrimidine/phosphomethylpyrimidine kinase
VLTPNVPEAAALTGRPVADLEGMRAAAEALLALGAGAVLVKGGHLTGAAVRDVLADAAGMEVFESPRIDTRHTHGTGCTLASAIATGLAQGLPLREAVVRARAYLQEALRRAPGLGQGHGPLGHGHTVKPF